MKKFLILAACAVSISAYSLPTYESFNEPLFANAIAATGSNAVDLATGGFTAPTGEVWGNLNWTGTRGTGLNGLDILVTNNPGLFTSTALSALLPSTFPGMPAPGQSITNVLMNPAQPLVGGAASANIIGNSAVLIFNTDITRPTSGTKTLYISYLYALDQGTQLGGGNDARYLAFVAQSNTTAPGGLPTWETMLDTLPGSYPNATHAVVAKGQPPGDNFIIGPCDSTTGLEFSAIPASASNNTATPYGEKYAAPMFVVGAITLTPSAKNNYTNTMWVNPAVSSFGGSTPPANPIWNDAVTLATQQISDIGGMIVEDRPGAGASHGGLGSNFMANIIIGTTWSYVTGGPEFTNQLPASLYLVGYGNPVTLSGAATAANQSVGYTWQRVTATTTNNLVNGQVNPGGSATVSIVTNANNVTTLTLPNAQSADMGTYQLVATASGTGESLTSVQTILTEVSDPYLALPQPQPVTVNKGGTASYSATAITSTGTISYQWYNGTTPVSNGAQGDGCSITGASGAVAGNSISTTLTLTGVTYNERGNYILWITNAASATASSIPAALTVNDPYLVTQPVSSYTGNYGTATTLTCVAAGAGTITYQWYNAAGPLSLAGDISGVNSTNLNFSALQLSDANTYYCVATGSGGSITSSPVVLSVLPIAIEPPTGVLVSQGTSTNIPVVTAPNVGFQWYSTNVGSPAVAMANSGDFSGVLTSNLVLTNPQTNDSGDYYVVVSWTNNSQTLYQTSTIVSLYVVSGIDLGPFPATNWPSTVQNSSQITYGIYDPNYASDTPSMATPPANWVNDVSIVAYNSSAQTWTSTEYAGLYGDQLTSTYFNIVETTQSQWARFSSYPIIDVLLQVWGGNNPFYTNGSVGSVSFEWCIGQLGQGPYYSKHYTFPAGLYNNQWNWVLLEITNPVDSVVDSSSSVIPGEHVVGDVGNPPFNSNGGAYGGVNNGTLRMDGFTIGAGFTVRAVALGPQGAFGLPSEINRFAQPSNCPPEPATNLVYIDINKGITDNLTVAINPTDEETYQTVTGGPPNDQRTAIQATSPFMEFPILNNALGQPCNGNYTMQLCMEVYDDPALAGEQFGPYAYADDAYGDIAFVPGYPNNYNQSFYTLQGSGQWVKVDWFVGPANLAGLYTAPLTGGPIVYWGLAANPPLVDRIELGVVATGTNALAGQIPDPSYNIDPLICSTNSNTNGYYAEWDPNHGVINNLAPPGTYSVTTTGPVNDQRIAEVPNSAGATSGAWYQQFDLQNSVFGPTLQDNSDVVMIVTYYDDPALAGVELFINEINSLQNGAPTLIPAAGTNVSVILKGTGKWVDAQFEVTGVNFSPSSLTAAPTFLCRFASYGAVYISRVRANVVRLCGQYEGIDYLQGNVNIAKTNGGAVLNWRGTATVLGSSAVNGQYGSVASVTNTMNNALPVTLTNKQEFYKLQFPSYPTNLSPYVPSP